MENFLMLVHKCLLELGREQVDLHMEDTIEPHIRSELAKSVCLKEKVRQYHMDGFITDDKAAGLHEILLFMEAEISMRTIIIHLCFDKATSRAVSSANIDIIGIANRSCHGHNTI